MGPRMLQRAAIVTSRQVWSMKKSLKNVEVMGGGQLLSKSTRTWGQLLWHCWSQSHRPKFRLTARWARRLTRNALWLWSITHTAAPWLRLNSIIRTLAWPRLWCPNQDPPWKTNRQLAVINKMKTTSLRLRTNHTAHASLTLWSTPTTRKCSSPRTKTRSEKWRHWPRWWQQSLLWSWLKICGWTSKEPISRYLKKRRAP